MVMAFVAAASLVVAGCSEGDVRRTISVVEEGGRAGYEPEVIRVQKGDRVDLVVLNRTTIVHGLTIRGYGVRPLEIAPQGRNNVAFTAKTAGTFQIRCQLHPAHRTAVFVVE